jgi:hypothetical protein
MSSNKEGSKGDIFLKAITWSLLRKKEGWKKPIPLKIPKKQEEACWTNKYKKLK